MARALDEAVNPAGTPGGNPPSGRPGGRKWSDFGVRLASAAILAPIALAALWYGGLAWQGLIVLIMLGLAMEWTRLSGLARGDIALAVALLTIWMLSILFGWMAGIPAAGLFILVTAWRFGWFAALGIPYIAIGGFSVLWLRLSLPDGLRVTASLVAVVWTTDIGAYFCGRLVGGRRLAPRISPGKTWSGSLGGLLIGGVAGALVMSGGRGIGPGALLLAVLLSLAAQAGDLLESAIKRRLGVKDSGRTIPGHGGLFDRLDGFLAASPVAVVLTFLTHHGLNRAI